MKKIVLLAAAICGSLGCKDAPPPQAKVEVHGVVEHTTTASKVDSHSHVHYLMSGEPEKVAWSDYYRKKIRLFACEQVAKKESLTWLGKRQPTLQMLNTKLQEQRFANTSLKIAKAFLF